MKKKYNRRSFAKSASLFGIGMALPNVSGVIGGKGPIKKLVGIVGMDTSHSPALVRAFNSSENYRVTTAFTTVSKDFPPSANRVERFTKEIVDMGVEVVRTLNELLDKVDYVLLCTVDPRLHLKQAKEIFRSGKRVFIDKPMATSLKEVIKISKISEKYGGTFFTSSSLRFMGSALEIRNGQNGKVLGADIFAPISYQSILPELYWYGIHGLELLYTVMKPGCIKVRRMSGKNFDFIIGVWADDRIGSYRGFKNTRISFGGRVFTDEGLVNMDDFEGLEPLHHAILRYFDTGEVPVGSHETIELFAFMEAAHVSVGRNGDWVFIDEIMDKATKSQ
ncbi:Gfo/Idh/MocA family oxidoreductase [Muricauda sp. ANG21]|uniref:Gfo/Idh/MocA family protein n=1 Tax=Allomuricauda sp. ANG21 TaxID=3042468 RepID=UPI003455A3FB